MTPSARPRRLGRARLAAALRRALNRQDHALEARERADERLAAITAEVASLVDQLAAYGPDDTQADA